MDEDLHTGRKCKRHDDDIDRLSKLPDQILSRILSFLETRDAVMTSVLSSRWKFIWMHITSLRFNDRKHETFAKFVNLVLILLKSKSIDEFSLEISYLCHLYDISTWFTVAIVRNPKVLKLHDNEHQDADIRFFIHGLPACLYTCKTLEVLDISSTINLYVPKFVCLPKLSMIKLYHVKYSSDESVRRIISGCSSLTHMWIERDKLDGVNTFTIDSPTLEFLHYTFVTHNGFVEHGYKFELNAPKLRCFHLCDNTSSDFSVDTLCPLVNAEIFVVLPQEPNDYDSNYKRVVKLLQGVYSVKHLWLTGDTLEALRDPLAPKMHSKFSSSMLIKEEKNKRLLQDLLEGSDTSHDIYMSKGSNTHVMRWRKPQGLHMCLLSHLESVSVSGFRGRESELNMIAYILKNGQALKKITISQATSKAGANYELLEKILKFDQGSERCEITFS